MADEPESATIRILQQIQATLADHTRRFEQIDGRFEQIDARFEQVDRRFQRMQEQMDYRFDAVDRRLTEVLDTAITALGSAGHANVRHDNVQHQLSESQLDLRHVKDRLRRLEDRV